MSPRFAFLSVSVLLIAVASIDAQLAKYEIVSLGQVGESVSGGQAVSPNGQFGTGFSDNDPFLWSSNGSLTNLPPAPGRPFNTPWSVNDSGSIVGIGATTFFGSSPLPVLWKNGDAILLSLPPGETLGRAYGINNDELVVGSVNGGSIERAATFSESSSGSMIMATLPGGGQLTVAYGVSDGGRIVGQGLDPQNAAVTKAWRLDPGETQATDIGSLTDIGHNSAIAFGVSSNGLITGSSSFNSGVNARAFLWSDENGMTEIDLPPGASSASGRGVNENGWVVGIAGGATSLPFLYDGTGTFLLQDLVIQGGKGWDLVGGTSNGAYSISNNGTIFGRAMLNGELTGFAMRRIVFAGDVNNDGVVSLLDVAPFVDAILNGENLPNADVNCDGVVDLLDVAPFVDILVST